MKRRYLLIFTALSMFSAVAGHAAADSLADIEARKKVLIALDLGSPPFGMLDASMQPYGADVEVAKLLAEQLGQPLEIVQVTSPNRIPYLQTSKADMVIASLSITDERKKVIDYSKPYGVIQSVIAAPAGQPVTAMADLKGKRIGTTRGSVNDKEVTKVSEGAEIVRYDDDATLVTALVSGQVDVMATSPQIMKAAIERNPSSNFEVKMVLKVFPYAIGIRKGDEALKSRLDRFVDDNLASGKLNAIYKKYNGVDLPDDMATLN
jgi:polar amino acid transport system substrate-binding protein